MHKIAFLTLFLPLFSSFILKISGVSFNKKHVKIFAILISLIIFGASVFILKEVFFFNRIITYNIASFINLIQNGELFWQISLDKLSSLLFSIVSFIALSVNVYSASYLDEEKDIYRFYCYLHLFVFFMLLLICSGNIIQFFAGWEGVGLCSYLLINFWYKKNSANEASYKAFIVNRIGDIGMLIGIFILFNFSASLNFYDIFNSSSALMSVNFFGAFNMLDLALFMFLIGAMAKSAQIFFHIWLPDAMEGPTPASALIHAATMVTAGIILMVRLFPLLQFSPTILFLITLIGAITSAVMGAIGIAQFDIKKIVAYSTCSQLGLMFVAIGAGVPSLAIFHLLTHAFFKALLFLGAGSVIHGMHGEQDLRQMGGLIKKMPVTFICLLIGSLALCGIYPLAGFYSKDAIFESIYAITFLKKTNFIMGYNIAFWSTYIAILFSGIYSFKIIFYAFFGKPKNSEKFNHAHESGIMMLLPMIVLAIFSIFSGLIGYNFMGLGQANDIASSWSNVFELMHLVPHGSATMPSILAVEGILISYFLYFINKEQVLTKFMKIISIPAKENFFFNQVYKATFGKFINFFSIIVNIIEKIIINKTIAGSIELCKILGLLFSSLQTGRFYHYTAIAMFGIVGILLLIIWGHY